MTNNWTKGTIHVADWTIVQNRQRAASSSRGRGGVPPGCPVACFWIRRQKIRRRETCRQQTRRQKRHWICQRSNLLPALDYLPMIILQSL